MIARLPQSLQRGVGWDVLVVCWWCGPEDMWRRVGWGGGCVERGGFLGGCCAPSAAKT